MKVPLAISILPPGAAESLLFQCDRPAARWTEALSVGNGRLGTMVFGGLAALGSRYGKVRSVLPRAKPVLILWALPRAIVIAVARTR